MEFLADKNVNVVTPLEGKWSYYTDWVNPDPVLGNNKWRTFLTEELPPMIDAGLGTTGKNAPRRTVHVGHHRPRAADRQAGAVPERRRVQRLRADQ